MEGNFKKLQDVCDLETMAANLVAPALYKSTGETSKGRPYLKLKEAVFGHTRIYVSNAIWEEKVVDKTCQIGLFHHVESDDPSSSILWLCKNNESRDDEMTMEL
jgi:hypothetical protein